MHRDRRLPLLAALAVVVSVLVAGLVARAQGCEAESCMYLPALQQGAGATIQAATPAWGPIPPILDGPCTVHEPAPTEGAQAWLTSYNLGPGDEATLCVRLIVGGQVVEGATVFFVARYQDRDRTSDNPAKTDARGLAVLPIALAAGVPLGQLVIVDAVAVAGDRAWPARVEFLAGVIVPTATNTPTPSNTPTATNTATNTPVPPTASPTETRTPTS